MVATPVAPALSRTVTVSVCGPFGVSVVTHGSVTCVADWLSDQTVAPAALRVNVKGGVEAEVIQMLSQVVPLTVCLALGVDTCTLAVPTSHPPSFPITRRT